MWEKKSKCPKRNFQSVEREKKCKCRISGVRKKGIERKVPREKKIKVFWGGNFAKFVFTGWFGSLQVKFTGKNDENFQSIFQVNVFFF